MRERANLFTRKWKLSSREELLVLLNRERNISRMHVKDVSVLEHVATDRIGMNRDDASTSHTNEIYCSPIFLQFADITL